MPKTNQNIILINNKNVFKRLDNIIAGLKRCEIFYHIKLFDNLKFNMIKYLKIHKGVFSQNQVRVGV